MFIVGEGVQKDETRAAELFGKACRLGRQPACARKPKP
jgi:hypothetical protein